jgi:hypothetical protein
MLIKSHLLTLAIGAASIATALAPAHARGFGGMAAHAGGMAVHAPSAPALGRTHFGSAMMRLPALHAPKIGAIPSVGPRGILTRTKVGQLPISVTHPVSFGQAAQSVIKGATTSSSPFGAAAKAVPGVTTTATGGSTFGEAAKALAGATATASSTSGTGIGQAVAKAMDAINKASAPSSSSQPSTAGGLQHGIDKLKLPAGALDKPPLATGPTPGGGLGHGIDKLKLPAGTVGDKAQIPATKGSDTGNHPLPYPAHPPHGPMGGGYGGGGVVVAAPVDDVPAVTVAGGAAAAVAGQRVVQQTPACGPTGIPRLAAALDELMPTAQLAAADLEAVRALRIAIADLAAAGKYMPARAVEEQAMSMLGYSKLWSRCGDGSFAWTKQVAAAE